MYIDNESENFQKSQNLMSKYNPYMMHVGGRKNFMLNFGIHPKSWLGMKLRNICDLDKLRK